MCIEFVTQVRKQKCACILSCWDGSVLRTNGPSMGERQGIAQKGVRAIEG